MLQPLIPGRSGAERVQCTAKCAAAGQHGYQPPPRTTWSTNASLIHYTGELQARCCQASKVTRPQRDRKKPVGLNEAARRLLVRHPLAHLATADLTGRPHVIPICFVLTNATLYSMIDRKPKRVPALRLRCVRNLLENPKPRGGCGRHRTREALGGSALLTKGSALLTKGRETAAADMKPTMATGNRAHGPQKKPDGMQVEIPVTSGFGLGRRGLAT